MYMGNRGGSSGRFGNRGGGGRGFRSGGSGGFGPRTMHKIKCSECGKDAEVPFEPKQGLPVYCRDCFMKRKGMPVRAEKKAEEKIEEAEEALEEAKEDLEEAEEAEEEAEEAA